MQAFDYLKQWMDRLFSNEESLVLALLLLGVTLAVLYFGTELAPLIAAMIIAFLLQGLVKQLMRLQLSRGAAVNLTFIVFLSILIALLFLLLPLIGRQVQSFVASLPSFMSRVQILLSTLPATYPELITQTQIESWVDLITRQIQAAGQWVLSRSLGLLPDLVSIVIYLLLVPILVFFLLRDGATLLAYIQSLLPRRRNILNRLSREMSNQFANYLRGKAVEILLVGTVTYFCFLFFNLNYALLLAALVGLSVLIPYIGAAVVTIPIAVVALLQWGWEPMAAWLMLAYGIIQLLDGNVLVPILFSGAVNLHPVSIIVAVLIFGGVWGVWGVFFAIPLATLVKAIYQSWPAALATGGAGRAGATPKASKAPISGEKADNV